MEIFLDGSDGYSLKHFKRKLREQYGDDIVITIISGSFSDVSFLGSAHKILQSKWKTGRLSDDMTKRDRIQDMAVSIILNDIRMKVYNINEYPTRH